MRCKMGRLINTDNLIGCAIIKPMTSEEFGHILACENKIVHDDIPTAFDVEAVVKQIEEWNKVTGALPEHSTWYYELISIIEKGGVK